MTIQFAPPIRKKLTELGDYDVIRLQADDYGLAYFPECGETVVSPLLVQRYWNNWPIHAHWMPIHGLGVGAYVNSNSAEFQMMGWREADSNQFETRFEEALADPVWVAEHAERARAEMLSQVEFAADLMEFLWEKAMNIPATHLARRWRATSVYKFSD